MIIEKRVLPVAKTVHAENEVKALQKLLGIAETGRFDAATNEALFKKTVEWQAGFNQGKDPKDGLKVDGWMGSKTLEALKTSDPGAYKVLNDLNEKISDQRAPGPDGKRVFGLGTLQSRIGGENGQPPKGQELDAAQIKAVTGKEFSVAQAGREERHPDVPYLDGAYALKSPGPRRADGASDEDSSLEMALGGAAAVVGLTGAAAFNAKATPPASPGTGLAVRSPVVQGALMPKDSGAVRVEKDITARASAETSGPNRPGRVGGAPGAASEAVAAETSAACGAVAAETEAKALARTAGTVEVAAKEASLLSKAFGVVASGVGKVLKPVAVIADPVMAAATASSGHRVAAAVSSMATADYTLGGLAVFGGAVVAPVAMTTIGLKAAWEHGNEYYAAEQQELKGELAPYEQKEVDLLKSAENRYGDLFVQIAVAAGKPVGETKDAARYLQEDGVFDKVWNHYQDKIDEAVRDGKPEAANDASLNMALLQDFMKTEAVRKAAEEKFKDDRDPMRAMSKNTDPNFVPVF